MTLIEEAARRLQELENAGIHTAARPPIPRSAGNLARAPTGRSIDLKSLAGAGFISPSVPDSKQLHEFRVIKRPLIQNALRKSAGMPANANLIMVTSSLPGEGKSFVAVNLAMSIAMEVDTRVLLVDADVIAPAVPRILGIPPAKGLMDVLMEPALGLGDVLLKTNIDRLGLLLAGTADRAAPELLASDAMARLLAELSSRYPDRIVIFDSPPLLATTESRVLAGNVGQVVVVVEAGKTTHADLESALSTVKTCPVVLTLLNKSTRSEPSGYYGYYGPSR
jgi:receptor protein-tyrosine kinase